MDVRGLWLADLGGADLRRADLRRADLRCGRGLTRHVRYRHWALLVQIAGVAPDLRAVHRRELGHGLPTPGE
ncbi:MAG: pentapeptide repeat-containing protein [Pseudomonadota bacterium]